MPLMSKTLTTNCSYLNVSLESCGDVNSLFSIKTPGKLFSGEFYNSKKKTVIILDRKKKGITPKQLTFNRDQT